MVENNSLQPHSQGDRVHLALDLVPYPDSLVRQLNSEQKRSAELSFRMTFLGTFTEIIKSHPQIPEQLMSEDSELFTMLRFASGALDLYEARQEGRNTGEEFEAFWGDKKAILETILGSNWNLIEHKKAEIYASAASWGSEEIKSMDSQADLFVNSLVNDLEDNQNSGFFDKNYVKQIVRNGVTGAANFASNWALESASVAGGTAIAAFNPLSEIDPKLALLVLSASYIAWGKSVWSNSKENWRLLESLGVSTSFTSKLAYDASGKITDKIQFRKAAALSGFIFWQIMTEVPYYIVAFNDVVNVPDIASNMTGSGNENNEIAFLAGANLTAAAYNFLQAKGIGRLLNMTKKT